MVSSSGAPIQIVRLDSRESRLAASRGKHFQITNVPSLVTIFTDGKLQLFVGTERIYPVLQNLLTPTPSPVEEDEISDIEYIEPPSPPCKGSKKKRRSASKSRTSSNGRQPRYAEPTEPRTRGSKKAASSRKAQQPPPPPDVEMFEEEDEEFEEEEEELEFEDATSQIAYRPPPPPTTGLMVGSAAPKGVSQNRSIMEIAKSMAKEREDTLGYSEKDLPKGRF